MLRPPKTARAKERIMLYGDTGAGKSYSWLTIAHLAHLTKSDAQFWVLDSDQEVELAIQPGFEFEHLANRIHVFDVPKSGDGVPEWLKASKTVRKNAGPNDWIIIDRLSVLWSILPSWWIEEVYQENELDYWATMRRISLGKEEGKKGFGGMAEAVDWQKIKSVRASIENPLVASRSHLLVTCDEKTVVEHFDRDGSERAKYEVVDNFKPGGDKESVKAYHSLYRLKRVAGVSELHMVRDRHMEHVWGESDKVKRGRVMPIKKGKTGFAKAVLVDLRGWKL